MIVIYIDVLFLVNFVINILIIEATGVIALERRIWYRTLLSTFIGGLYAVVMFFPDMSFLGSALMKLALSAVMVLCAFKVKSRRHFMVVTGWFYLVSFIFGGGISALLCFSSLGAKVGAVISNGNLYFNLPWSTLFLLAGIIYIMICAFGKVRKKKVNREGMKRNLIININGQKIETTAIIDTGNNLFDPITGAPVIVCDYLTLGKILPQKSEDLFESMQKAGLKIRLIPFTSVGMQKGIMPGFCPDKVWIDAICVKKCVVGISEIKVSSEGEYHALLNPQLVA